EVFDNPRLEGMPAATRIDKQIDLQWDHEERVSNVHATNISVRWTGVLVAPRSGSYIFTMEVQGPIRLFIGDKPLIDFWANGAKGTLSASAELKAGTAYKVKLEYAQTSGHGQIQFGWRLPEPDDALERAMAAAKEADHIVLTLGLTPNLEGEEMTVNAEGFNG